LRIILRILRKVSIYQFKNHPIDLYSDLQETVQAWQPIALRLSMTKPKFIVCQRTVAPLTGSSIQNQKM